MKEIGAQEPHPICWEAVFVFYAVTGSKRSVTTRID